MSVFAKYTGGQASGPKVPASTTENALVRWGDTTGSTLLSSSIISSDGSALSLPHLYTSIDVNSPLYTSPAGINITAAAGNAILSTSTDAARYLYFHAYSANVSTQKSLGLFTDSVNQLGGPPPFTPLFDTVPACLLFTGNGPDVSIWLDNINNNLNTVFSSLNLNVNFLQFLYDNTTPHYGIPPQTPIVSVYPQLVLQKGLTVSEAANGKQGVVTLVGGTATISNTSVTATSRIFLTAQSLGTVTAPKALAVTARTAGTSFTITSSDATDTSVVAYEIFEAY